MNKQELASEIWAGANELRGKVSASSYKDYMLGFIFYKYLSEKEERYLREKLFFEDADFDNLTEKDVDVVNNCKDNLGFFIEKKNLFSEWINLGLDFSVKNVREALKTFNSGNIGDNYRKVYNGIFNTLDNGLNEFGSADPERSNAIRKLLNLIRRIPVDGSQEYDVLGFIYEFLLKNFAANAGKAGEFYTPYEASTIMSELIAEHLKDRKEISIYDPTSGSGSLLINIGKSVAKHINNSNMIKYYAQELISQTYNLTRMNLIMHDVLPDNVLVRNGDTLKDDWPFFEEDDKERTYEPVFVDGCCSNPPYSQPWENDKADNDIRFANYGVAPKSKADLAFLLHNLYHLKSDGIMTIVMPHGVLFRGGEEGIIRKNLVEKGNIETIIGLPANMFFGTGIPTIIIVLKKQRESNDILFIDASKGFIKDGNKNRLRAKDVKRIVDTVLNRETVEGYSRLVEKSEIEENDYNLNIPRYVESNDDTEKWDIYATMFGGIPDSELDELDVFWKTFPSLKSELFEKSNGPYQRIKTDDINNTTFNNQDVKAFLAKTEDTLKSFPQYLSDRLIDRYMDIVVNREETNIAQELIRLMSSIPLVDYYDAYQVLDDKWNSIALDLEILQAEGFSAANEIDIEKELKKDSKTKELKEVEKGEVGRIFPFELIESVYFADEKTKLDDFKSALSSAQSEKDELLESIDPNDKTEIVNDDGEIVADKLKKVISKLKQEIKKGAEFDEDSYEDIMMRVDKINTNMSKLKKNIKELSKDLEKETKNKIKTLSSNETKDLLRKKWIDPLYENLIVLSKEVINQYVKEIERLNSKYKITMDDISSQTKETESCLSSMLSELTGEDYDMKGIEEFKKILGGKNNE